MDGTRLLRPVAASVLIALLAAGCGGGGSDAAPAVVTAGVVGTSAKWTMPIELEHQPGKVEYPSAGMSANGDIITVFAQRIGDRIAVHAVHGNVDAMRFGAPRIIDQASTSAQSPLRLSGKTQSATQVAVNPATGDAVAVWSAMTGSVPHVWSAHYHRAADAWSVPVQLDAAAEGASYPSVAMNAQGKAIAAWSEAAVDDTSRNASAAVFAGGTWQRPVRLSARAAGEAPQAGIDAAGNMLVAWVEKDASGTDDIVAARITGTGMVQHTQVVDASAAPAALPALAVAPGGAAVLAWVQSDGSHASVHASRLAGNGWSAPERIENLPNTSFAPAVTLNDAGGFVAWEQEEAAGFSGHAYAARVNASQGWEEPVRVYTRGGYMPAIRIQDNGDALMIWLAAHTQYARYSAASGRWGEVTNLSPYNCGNGHTLAFDPASGKAFAAWIPSVCSRSDDLYAAFFR